MNGPLAVVVFFVLDLSWAYWLGWRRINRSPRLHWSFAVYDAIGRPAEAIRARRLSP
jgi:hypothetical protein